MNQIRDQSFSPGSAGTRWENLQRVGLHADVKTLETYEDRVLEGMKKLRLKIQKQPSSSLSVQDVKAYHKVLFDKVHPWAGQIRKNDENVRIGKHLGCCAQRLNIELEMWAAQSKEMFQKAKTPHEKMAAVAFSHARFERIHPFRDGNGRTGRAIMNSQLTAEFGSNSNRALFARDTYIAALKEAEHGNLTTLTNLLAVREGLPPSHEKVYAPYRLAPFTELTIGSLREEMNLSQSSQEAMNKMLGIMDRSKAG